MHALNKLEIAAAVTEAIYRGNHVLHDPPVVKARKQAGADIRQAAKSTSQLLAEARSSWARSAHA